MQSVFTSKKVITNINGRENYSEEIFQHSNNGVEEVNNIVFRQLVYVEKKPYIVSINLNGKEVKLTIIDLENNQFIEEVMSEKEIIEYFQNIQKTLPKSINKINKKEKSSKKTIKNKKSKSASGTKSTSRSKSASGTKSTSRSKSASGTKSTSGNKSASGTKSTSRSKSASGTKSTSRSKSASKIKHASGNKK